MSIDRERVRSVIESLVFVSESPVPFARIRAILDDMPAADLKSLLDEMTADYSNPQHGFLLEEVALGYQFRTKSENADWVRRLIEKKPQKLSKASLETLAIVAYNQPITKPEIETIRGVDCSSAIGILLERRMIRLLGRKDAPGKPFIFGTTREFLELFNLKDLSALPTLREIEQIEDNADEFANPGGATPDAPAPGEQASGDDGTEDPEDTEQVAGDDTDADLPQEIDEDEFEDEDESAGSEDDN